MRIAVISDTHLHEPGPWLSKVYDKYLAGADMLVHCGDITGFSVWSFFNRHPGFVVARGNMDEWRLVDELRDRESFSAEGKRIGVTHGYGYGYGANLKSGIAEAFGPGFDVVCFGHTHKREWIEMNGVWLLNPGSLQAGIMSNGSLAYLLIDESGRIEPEFVDVPGKL